MKVCLVKMFKFYLSPKLVLNEEFSVCKKQFIYNYFFMNFSLIFKSTSSRKRILSSCENPM